MASLHHVLKGHAQICEVHTLDEAISQLQPGLDLIICGIHFDDSRMFDLLRLAKATPTTREVPFLCYRDLDTRLPQTLVEGMEIATRAGGAVGFVDLVTLKTRFGVKRADERLRQMILKLAQQC